jgi:hypothetical protein
MPGPYHNNVVLLRHFFPSSRHPILDANVIVVKVEIFSFYHGDIEITARPKAATKTLTTEAQRTQSQELILSAAEAADSILHAASRHGEYLFFSVASVPLWFNESSHA